MFANRIFTDLDRNYAHEPEMLRERSVCFAYACSSSEMACGLSG